MLFIILSFFVILVDQLTKLCIQVYIRENESISVIGNIFYFTHIHNKGAAFGLFPQLSFFFIVITVVVIIAIILYYRQISFISTKISLSLVLGGAMGNLIDRIRIGKVIDFIDFRIWPVFNLADTCICIGIFILILTMSKKEHLFSK